MSKTLKKMGKFSIGQMRQGVYGGHYFLFAYNKLVAVTLSLKRRHELFLKLKNTQFYGQN